MFATATVGPIGVETVIETIRPTAAQSTEITAELIITLLNVLKMRIEESAGKVISDEMRSAPTIRIAMTMTTPVTAARSVL
jgi:glycine cleavage system regulatory protein